MTGDPLDILTLIWDRRPRALLEAATGLGFDYPGRVKTPGENVDDGEPPRRVGEGEWVPIDECLGLYDPKTSGITLFSEGIRDASSLIGCDPAELCLVVRVHEFAHALVHLGPYVEAFRAAPGIPERANVQKKADRLFAKVPSALHEQLAQVLTYHALAVTDSVGGWDGETRDRCLGVFGDLMRHQPPEYRVSDLVGAPKERVVKSLGMIRDRTLAADLDAWRAVLTW